LLAKVEVGKADKTILCQFATLTYRLGFESDKICTLKQRSPDREIACNALLDARKPDCYKYNNTIFESYIAQIVRMFSAAMLLRSEQLSPVLASEDPSASGDRCRFPDEEAHEEDSKLLFINNLYNTGEGQGEAITSFFVRRSVYFAFFGKSMNLLLNVSSTHLRQCNTTDSNMTRAPQENIAMQDVRQGEVEQDRLEQRRLAIPAAHQQVRINLTQRY
jgi:Protein of unknown function (DUF3723)